MERLQGREEWCPAVMLQRSWHILTSWTHAGSEISVSLCDILHMLNS